jgi:hypothetical protein
MYHCHRGKSPRKKSKCFSIPFSEGICKFEGRVLTNNSERDAGKARGTYGREEKCIQALSDCLKESDLQKTSLIGE